MAGHKQLVQYCEVVCLFVCLSVRLCQISQTTKQKNPQQDAMRYDTIRRDAKRLATARG